MLPSIHREVIPGAPHVEQLPTEVARPGPSEGMRNNGVSSGSTGKVRGGAMYQNGDGLHSAPGSTGAQPNWPQSYALEKLPNEYGNSRAPGVMVDTKGKEFIVNGDHGYPVRYDTANRTWRIVQPDNPAKPGIPVTRRDDGTWSVNSDVGLKGGGDTRSQRVSELTHRKQSVEGEMRRSKDRMDQLNGRLQDLGRRYDEINRRVEELSRRMREAWSQDVLYEHGKLMADLMTITSKEEEINRERNAESSKYTYSSIELHSIKRELESINLSHWTS
jgi:hypothetical protein